MIIKSQSLTKVNENGLYIVSTPIGKLKDITLRAIEILRKSDFILCEDTRVSKNLLDRYEIKSKLISNHKFNEKKNIVKIIEYLKSGKTISLISDAGTPAISDPGFLLIRECIKEKIEVDCLPGATAFIPALINSGLPTDKFLFEGFLPLKKGRVTRLLSLSDEVRTLVFYESPHRIIKTLTQFLEYFGNKKLMF